MKWWYSLADLAEAAGMTVGSARVMRHRGLLPTADRHVGIRPQWKRPTVLRYLRARAGRGRYAEVPPGFVTVAQLAAQLGVSTAAIRTYRHRGRMPPPSKVLPDGRLVWRQAVADRWVEQRFASPLKRAPRPRQAAPPTVVASATTRRR